MSKKYFFRNISLTGGPLPPWEHLGIKFEYTSRSTPQHNGVVERKYQTLYNRLRATMNEAGFEDKMRYDLWAECALCVTILENICVNENQDKSPYELFYGNKCKITKYLRVLEKLE